MITDTIHSFYADIGWADHAKTIALWEERWQREGWKTRVLGIGDAEKDPRFSAMVAKSLVVPSVNPRVFEKANFLRWLAFSHVDGAVADYDVFPIKPFPPQDFGGFVCGWQSGSPGFIMGKGSDFSRIADAIIAYVVRSSDLTNGQPHVSDMVILNNTPSLFDRCCPLQTGYGDPGWEQGPLVHFSTDGLGRSAIPGTKSEQIRTVLGRVYP